VTTDDDEWRMSKRMRGIRPHDCRGQVCANLMQPGVNLASHNRRSRRRASSSTGQGTAVIGRGRLPLPGLTFRHAGIALFASPPWVRRARETDIDLTSLRKRPMKRYLRRPPIMHAGVRRSPHGVPEPAQSGVPHPLATVIGVGAWSRGSVLEACADLRRRATSAEHLPARRASSGNSRGRTRNSPSRWRFRPLSPLTVRFRVEPPG
jgi:hypothetical protein